MGWYETEIYILWYVDKLLGNDCEITALQTSIISTARRECNNNGRDIFYMVRAEMSQAEPVGS
jgi:hypothetical protein